jgi:hypothetical protein
MEIINHTPFPYLYFKASTSQDQIANAIVVKLKYDLSNGQMILSKDQNSKLSNAPVQDQYGEFDSENIYRRGGVDFFVLGSAIPRSKEEQKKMIVQVYLPGKIDQSIAIFGNRKWDLSLLGLKISEPEPFVEMPISIYNAYGGVDDYDGLKFPFVNNKFGKGFIWDKKNAVGVSLPNIENPTKLIQNWNDRPLPTGLGPCPMNEERLMRGIRINKEQEVEDINPILFNNAFSRMIANNIIGGEQIVVKGMSKEGISKFIIPTTNLELNLYFGEKYHSRLFEIDQVTLDLNAQLCHITYRYYFSFQYRKLEKRILEIKL